MLACEVEDRPEALDLMRRIQKAQDHLHGLYEDVRGYAAPIRLDRGRVRPARLLAGGLGDPGAGPRGPRRRLREATATGADLRCVADRSAWSRSSATSWRTPWPPCPTRSRSASRWSDAELGRPAGGAGRRSATTGRG